MRCEINVSSFWLRTCGSIYRWFYKNCTFLPPQDISQDVSPGSEYTCVELFLYIVYFGAFRLLQVISPAFLQILFDNWWFLWCPCVAMVVAPMSALEVWSYAFHVPKGVFIIIRLTQIPLFSTCHTRVTATCSCQAIPCRWFHTSINTCPFCTQMALAPWLTYSNVPDISV